MKETRVYYKSSPNIFFFIFGVINHAEPREVGYEEVLLLAKETESFYMEAEKERYRSVLEEQ